MNQWINGPMDQCSNGPMVQWTTDMIFVKSFTQARFQQIWKFTPITRKPRHVLPPKTPFKSKQMWDSPTVLLRYALSFLYNIKLVKNYTKIFEITQDMSSPAEILPNIEIIYTSAACDACDKYHVWAPLVAISHAFAVHPNISYYILLNIMAIDWF